MCALVRRAASAHHDSGRYNQAATGHARVRSAYTQVTATWQLVTLPIVPVYWRATPTEARPCLRKPVSSKINTASPALGRESLRFTRWQLSASASHCMVVAALGVVVRWCQEGWLPRCRSSCADRMIGQEA